MTSTLIMAQNNVYWIGGTPGKENNWNEARNWSSQEVPDASSHVIIKDSNSGHHAMPVISKKAIVGSIQLLSNAKLIIKTGAKLTIDGTDVYSEGVSFYGGRLINNGSMTFINVESEFLEDIASSVQNHGELMFGKDDWVQALSYIE